MKIQHPKVASALRTLQHLMRQKTPEDQVAAHWAVPSELAENMAFGLSRAELDALKAAERALLADQAFEHIGDGVDKKVWAFAAGCAIDKKSNFVPLFVAEHARDVESRLCYVAVDYLKVSLERECVGVRFLPVDAAEIPRHPAVPGVFSERPVGSVAVVDVQGTDRERMVERARPGRSRA